MCKNKYFFADNTELGGNS